MPNYKDGVPQPKAAANPAGIQTTPWQPGQKKERPLTWGTKEAAQEQGLTATQRYQQRVRNYGGGAGSASWNAPTQPQQPPPQEQLEYETADEVLGEEAGPPQPYQMDTTGLQTSHFSPPPKFAPGGSPAPGKTASPAPPPRQGGYTKPTSAFAPPPSGVRGAAARPTPAPPPRLPQRQNSHPDEFTASPPPAYGAEPEEYAAPSGPPPQAAGNAQLNELQARFARMGTGGSSSGGDVAAAAAAKKKPPPPPAKKAGLGAGGGSGGAAPPPVPHSSRPTF